MKIFYKLIWIIRYLFIFLEKISRKLIIPNKIYEKIGNTKSRRKLSIIHSNIEKIRIKYPKENELIKIQALIEKKLILDELDE